MQWCTGTRILKWCWKAVKVGYAKQKTHKTYQKIGCGMKKLKSNHKMKNTKWIVCFFLAKLQYTNWDTYGGPTQTTPPMRNCLREGYLSRSAYAVASTKFAATISLLDMTWSQFCFRRGIGSRTYAFPTRGPTWSLRESRTENRFPA